MKRRAARGNQKSRIKNRKSLMAFKIGFVGLGRMGANMARRLHETGHAVVAVYDHDPGKARALATEIGTQPATTLAAVTAASDLIFTVVSDDRAQLAIFAETGDS